MQNKKDSAYRLELAKNFLQEAEQDFDLRRWRSCVSNAQLSSENSGKAIIAIFEPIEKTHEPTIQLQEMLKDNIFPKNIVEKVEEIIPLSKKLGLEEHFKTDYGDEESLKTPWQIFTSDKAKEALEVARKAFSLAEEIYNKIFGLQ